MNDMQKRLTLTIAGIIGGSALITGAILAHDENMHGDERRAFQKAREEVRATLTMARDFTQAAVKSNAGSEMACTALKSAMSQMAVKNLSYEDVGTTKEKFDMIRDYNGCKFN